MFLPDGTDELQADQALARSWGRVRRVVSAQSLPIVELRILKSAVVDAGVGTSKLDRLMDELAENIAWRREQIAVGRQEHHGQLSVEEQVLAALHEFRRAIARAGALSVLLVRVILLDLVAGLTISRAGAPICGRVEFPPDRIDRAGPCVPHGPPAAGETLAA